MSFNTNSLNAHKQYISKYIYTNLNKKIWFGGQLALKNHTETKSRIANIKYCRPKK